MRGRVRRPRTCWNGRNWDMGTGAAGFMLGVVAASSSMANTQASHSSSGYCASWAVANPVAVGPQGSCGCVSSHLMATRSNTSELVKKVVSLRRAPPYIQERRSTKWHVVRRLERNGSSHNQLFPGFSMVMTAFSGVGEGTCFLAKVVGCLHLKPILLG